MSYIVIDCYNSCCEARKEAMISSAQCVNSPPTANEEKDFGEFRRKVRSAELLSAAMERLLWSLHFTGRLSVVVQNGRVLKSGYEEGYFRQASELRAAL